MVRTLNVDTNVDLCFMLSCELVRRLPNLKRWKFSTAHIPGVEGVVVALEISMSSSGCLEMAIAAYNS